MSAMVVSEKNEKKGKREKLRKKKKQKQKEKWLQDLPCATRMQEHQIKKKQKKG